MENLLNLKRVARVSRHDTVLKASVTLRGAARSADENMPDATEYATASDIRQSKIRWEIKSAPVGHSFFPSNSRVTRTSRRRWKRIFANSSGLHSQNIDVALGENREDRSAFPGYNYRFSFLARGIRDVSREYKGERRD